MKILVTGGAGFIGSALIRAAIAKGHSVINVDALTYAASLESLASIADSPDYVFEHVDIRNANALKRVFDKHKPEAVMHLAAKSSMPKFIRAKRYICGIRNFALHAVKIASKRLCRVFSVFADFNQRKMLRLYDGGQVAK